MIVKSLLWRASSSASIQCRFLASAAAGNDEKLVKVTRENNGVTHVVLDRPEGKNSLSKKMIEEFNDSIQGLHKDAKTNVVVISSAVNRVFCAGADLKERKAMPENEIGNFVKGLRSAFTAVEDLPMPVIAAIEGAALGGGLELALACDLRICSESSLLGLPETSLAIIPGAGGTQRLPRVLGLTKAKELVYMAKRLSGKESEEIGLVTECVQDGQALQRAVEIAKRINLGGPVALRMAKAAINEGTQGSLKEGLEVEGRCYGTVIPTKDRIEGLKAFAEKRKPEYVGA